MRTNKIKRSEDLNEDEIEQTLIQIKTEVATGLKQVQSELSARRHQLANIVQEGQEQKDLKL